jgi:Ca-activated chloride channel family protein
MKYPMKQFFVAVFSAALLFAPALPAQRIEDLPSAPSATRQQPAPQSKLSSSNAASGPDSTPGTMAPVPAHAGPEKPAAAAAEVQSAQPPEQGKGAAPRPVSPQLQASHAKAAPEPKPTSSASADIPDDEPLATITKRVDEVNVIFTVTDKHGKFVKDLTEKDFTIRDDNKPPRQVVSFSRQTNLPLRVGLLIDASNSIRDRFRFEQEAAAEFLAQSIRPKADLGFVIGFDTTAELTADFSDNTEILGRGIRMLRPGGGTAMYDAVYFACREKLMKAPQSGPVRRAIILISDGEDNQSRVTREEAIEMAQRAEVIIYAISTNTSGVKLRGDKVMERMAEATGGRAFFPFKIQDVATALAQIQDELRSQYAIAYKPADFVPDGHFRTIQIVAENHKNLKVRSRRGYYAPKQ